MHLSYNTIMIFYIIDKKTKTIIEKRTIVDVGNMVVCTIEIMGNSPDKGKRIKCSTYDLFDVKHGHEMIM